MINIDDIRERYLRDSLPVRLGGLAANLARIRSFCAHDAGNHAVESLIDESKHFIEWTASEADTATAAELAQLQIMLASWQLDWPQIWADNARRAEIIDQAHAWSKRVLEMSGLLHRDV